MGVFIGVRAYAPEVYKGLLENLQMFCNFVNKNMKKNTQPLLCGGQITLSNFVM